jgi:hypothetical protein
MKTHEMTVSENATPAVASELPQQHQVEIVQDGIKVVHNVHRVCALFPDMSDVEYAELVKSIKRHGQLQPVVLHQGVLLDGRHRLRACAELGLEPKLIQFAELRLSTAPGTWVLTVNARRRHLTDDQKLAIMANYNDWFKSQKSKLKPLPHIVDDARAIDNSPPNAPDPDAEAPASKQDEFPPRNQDGNSEAKRTPGRPAGSGKGRAAEQLAKATGQSRYRAEGILKVRKHSPEMTKAVVEGSMPLTEALAKLKTQQAPAAPVATEQPTDQSKLETAVRSATLSLEKREKTLCISLRGVFWEQIAEFASQRAKG